jgi:hypothetical protein
LQKTSKFLIALAKIIWPDLLKVTLLPRQSAGPAPLSGKAASTQALRGALPPRDALGGAPFLPRSPS